MKNKNRTYKFAYIAAVVVISVVIFIIQQSKEAMKVENTSNEGADVVLHMIDVGQGDAVFIDNGDNDILIDAGTGESAPVLLEYIENLETQSIKYAFFSHPHEDHIGGGDDVITRFDVENVVMPKYSEDTACYRNLMDAIGQRDCKLTYAFSGDEFTVGDVKVEILSPGKGYKTDDANHTSFIMKVSYGEIDMMFTGDAEQTNESYVLRRYPEKLDCEILKVGHHGSSSSSTEEFLAAVTPEIALISLGEGNPYGHPHRETLVRLNSYVDELHRTDREGDLVIGMTRDKYWFVDDVAK